MRENDIFPLYSESTPSGCRLLRKVRREEGERQVNRGAWHRRYDQVSEEFIGYQVGLSDSDLRGDFDMLSIFTPAAISANEMEVFAGLHGCSRTAHLAEDRRLTKERPEDAIERTQCKVLVWPQVTAVRQDILRVWPRPA